MRESGLQASSAPALPAYDDSQHAFPAAPNELDQDVAGAGPNEKWGTDLSYIGTREGWLYLAVAIDLDARSVVGSAAVDRLHEELALTALRRALVMRRPAACFLHQSDRGSQSGSNEYRIELRRHGIALSMSGKGNCYDNALVEMFFRTLKSEPVWRTGVQTRTEATEAPARYIDGFYDPRRRHSALGFVSPIQFANRSANQTALH